MKPFMTDPQNPLPLYYQVYHSLKERIVEGEFKPGDALPSERRLVEQYGVSRITVVKALDSLAADELIDRQHGRGTFVREPVVRETAVQHRAIGFIPGGLLHPYHYNIQLGIARGIAGQNCHLHVIGLDEETRNDVDTLLEIITTSVDGIILYPRPDRQDYQLCQKLEARGFPLVKVDRVYRGLTSDSVVFAEEQGGYELTQLLIQQGHKRIAILPSYEVNISSVRNRIAGYKRALEEASLPVDDELIWLTTYSNLHVSRGEKGDARMTKRLQEHIDKHNPTAILAMNQDVAERLTHDLMLINTERAHAVIAQNGSANFELALAVASFGEARPEDLGQAHVATAFQPGERLGEKAAAMLIERLNDPQLPPQNKVLRLDVLTRR